MVAPGAYHDKRQAKCLRAARSVPCNAGASCNGTTQKGVYQ
jgi:hypothetical protein